MQQNKETKRYHYAPAYFMNPVEPIKIMVIGAGGNGSIMMQLLARIHISLIGLGFMGLDVTLVDGDKVEISNVGRQMFSPEDVGHYKSTALITKINRFYDVHWKARQCYMTFNSSIVQQNIVITCVDSLNARLDFIDKQMYFDTNKENRLYYWMDLGNSSNTGQVILGTMCSIEQPAKHYVANLKHRFDLFPVEREEKEDNEPSCNLAQALGKQDLFINQFVASYAADMLWELLRNYRLDYHGIFVNTNSKEVTKIPIT